MKKIISIMLSVLFIISSVNIVFAENERYSEEKIQEALGILYKRYCCKSGSNKSRVLILCG